MVMTILEAQVKPENWQNLEQVFKDKSGQLPPEIVQTYLIQSNSDQTIWRIMTIWKTREALESMRKAGTPEGVLMFRSAGSEPSFSSFEIKFSRPA